MKQKEYIIQHHGNSGWIDTNIFTPFSDKEEATKTLEKLEDSYVLSGNYRIIIREYEVLNEWE